jgi:Tfp pilus assembly protein PilF
VLYQRLGELYERRLGDYMQAAHYFELATQYPDAPSYLPRFVGYMLLKAGKDQQAYDYWKRIWPTLSDKEKGSIQWGRVRSEIKKLEEKLNLPRQDRILKN